MYKAHNCTQSIKPNRPIYIQQPNGNFKIVTFKVNETGDIIKELEGFTPTLPTGTIAFNPIEYIVAKSNFIRFINLEE